MLYLRIRAQKNKYKDTAKQGPQHLIQTSASLPGLPNCKPEFIIGAHIRGINRRIAATLSACPVCPYPIRRSSLFVIILRFVRC